MHSCCVCTTCPNLSCLVNNKLVTFKMLAPFPVDCSDASVTLRHRLLVCVKLQLIKLVLYAEVYVVASSVWMQSSWLHTVVIKTEICYLLHIEKHRL